MTTNTEVSFDAALSALRREYYTDVRNAAKDIRGEIESGDITDRDGLYTRVHETVDGNQWVIYTQRAQIVLMISSNDSAYADEYGTEGIISDGGVNWSALAFAAMEADLWEYLEREGVDANGDSRAAMLGEEESDD